MAAADPGHLQEHIVSCPYLLERSKWMRPEKHQRIRLLGLAVVLAQALGVGPAHGGSKPDPLAERVRFLHAEVKKMRKSNDLSAENLSKKLLARFPIGSSSSAAAKAGMELLLKASVRVDNLDTRAYNEPQTGAGDYKPPEDIATSTKVYNIDLFNALLGRKSRLEPAKDLDGRTALMYAAEANQFEVLRTLLLLPSKIKPFEPLYKQTDANGRGYTDWCDKDGYTALMHAASARSITAVNYLLNAGASIDTKCRVAQFDALQLARNAGDVMVISAIESALARRQSEANAARWWYDRQWWKELLTNHEVMATVLFGLLAWGFYLAVWRARREIRLGRVREEVQNLVDQDERLQVMAIGARSEIAALVKRKLLSLERFRSRNKVVPNLVQDADRDYVHTTYREVRDAVLKEHASSTADRGAASSG